MICPLVPLLSDGDLDDAPLAYQLVEHADDMSRILGRCDPSASVALAVSVDAVVVVDSHSQFPMGK